MSYTVADEKENERVQNIIAGIVTSNIGIKTEEIFEKLEKENAINTTTALQALLQLSYKKTLHYKPVILARTMNWYPVDQEKLNQADKGVGHTKSNPGP